MENEKISYLQKTILNWYKQFGRKFPWREQGVGDYKLLISEILLSYIEPFFVPVETNIPEAVEEVAESVQ